MLEHLDRRVVSDFLLEVKRVLVPGGIHRIVVPDLEQLCRRYLGHLEKCERDQSERTHHDSYVASIIEQSVRKESFGTSQQRPFRRRLENLVLGDARQRGETHQWMYDWVNLSEALRLAGYRDVTVQRYDSSNIPDWSSYSLDVDDCGRQYKPDSLYVEASK